MSAMEIENMTAIERKSAWKRILVSERDIAVAIHEREYEERLAAETQTVRNSGKDCREV